MKDDIENRDDIQNFVFAFYSKVQKDSLLSPIFASRIPAEDWPVHLQRMVDFWSAILFTERGFEGNPLQKHVSLPIDESHFSRWLSLFTETIDERFAGTKADEAKKRAASIAHIMNFKIHTFRA